MIGDLGNRTYSCIWGVSSNGKAKCNRSLMTNAYGVKSSKNTFENDFDGDPLKSVVSPSTYAFRVLPGTPGRIHTLVYIWNGSTETVVYIYIWYTGINHLINHFFSNWPGPGLRRPANWEVNSCMAQATFILTYGRLLVVHPTYCCK